PVMHSADTRRERIISGGFGGPGVDGGQPGIERRTRDLNDRAEPLHLEGVPVVGDELEAAHQFVSPAKYLAAARRMSRSVFSFTDSASSSRTRARNRLASCSGVSSGPGGAAVWPRLRIATPTPLSQADREPCAIPRSAAIWATVAPSVTRYSSTASLRNSSE